MTLLSRLHSAAFARVNAYRHLKIGALSFSAPYFINTYGAALQELLIKAEIPKELRGRVHTLYKQRKTTFGWFRGKGTPEQLVDGTITLLQQTATPTTIFTEYGVREFMKQYGLGVDCSGFVFHVLHDAFQSENMNDAFLNSLNWNQESHDVDHAGAFTFASPTSFLVQPKEVRPLDLILIRNGSTYSHIALIVEQESSLYIAQSSAMTNPTGVTLTPFSVTEDEPHFAVHEAIGTSWHNLYAEGVLEFRRLQVLTAE